MWARYFRLRPEKEVRLNMSILIRQAHRWLSIAFTLTVVANFAAMARGTPPVWITYSPLLPLFLLMFSGLYMFALPCAGAWQRKRKQS
jgi:cellulose synthase/poly-beta-1,6-N-acetylglucosamine synthase-like glycosyltransferase